MRTLVLFALVLAGCNFADVTAFAHAAPLGYANWQVAAVVLWLGLTIWLKRQPPEKVRANDPLELLANLLVRVPLVGKVAQPLTTPAAPKFEVVAGVDFQRVPPALLLLVPLLLAPACATVQLAKGHYEVIPPDQAACTAALIRAAAAQAPCDRSPPPPTEEIVKCAALAAAEMTPCSPIFKWVPDALVASGN